MTEAVYHPTTPALAARRKELAPATHQAFEEFSRSTSQMFSTEARDKRHDRVTILPKLFFIRDRALHNHVSRHYPLHLASEIPMT